MGQWVFGWGSLGSPWLGAIEYPDAGVRGKVGAFGLFGGSVRRARRRTGRGVDLAGGNRRGHGGRRWGWWCSFVGPDYSASPRGTPWRSLRRFRLYTFLCLPRVLTAIEDGIY